MDDFFELGTLGRPYGLQGGLHLFMDCDDPLQYANLKFVYITFQGQLIPYKIVKLEIRDNNMAVIQLEGIKNQQDAAKYNGVPVFLPLSQLPVLADHQFYYHDVIGYRALNESGEEIGIVSEISENTAQDLFQIKHKQGTYFIPVHDAFLIETNKAERYFRFKLPEGYLDLFLGETKS